MKRSLLFIMAFFAILPSIADEILIDGINYLIYPSEENKTAMVIPLSGADNPTGDEKYKGDITIPEMVTHNEIKYAVTEIDDWLFYESAELTSVSLPSKITAIPNYTFYYCSSLEKVEFNGNVTSIGECAFEGCSSLKSIDSMAKVSEIGRSAFNECSCLELTSLDFLNNMSIIRNDCFRNCRSLKVKGLTIPSKISKIEEGAFSNCIGIEGKLTIPESVENIGSGAFSGCTGIQEISIDDSEKSLSIGTGSIVEARLEGMFFNSPITTLYLGRNLEYSVESEYWEVGSPFEGVSTLKNITLGTNVTKIGKSLFKNCTGLDALTIPSSVTEIGNDAFANSPVSLTFVSETPATVDDAFGRIALLFVPADAYQDYYEAWPRHYTQIIRQGSTTNYEITVNAKDDTSNVLEKIKGESTNVYSVISLKVSGTINSYDIMVMRNKLLNLRSLDLSEATIVTNAYEYYQGYHSENDRVTAFSFYNLKNLKEVKLPNTATAIEAFAFAKCSNLQTVVLGKGTKIIEDGMHLAPEGGWIIYGAFTYCNINDLQLNEELDTIGSYAFYGNKIENLTLNKNLKSIHEAAFSANYDLKSVILNESLETIGDQAFEQCISMDNIVFSPGLRTIGNSAFANCYSLKSVMLPLTLQSIGGAAFEGCWSLTELRIPESIEIIGDGAFYVSSIRDIYTWTIEPTNINQNTFHSDLYRMATLHVPMTSKNLYYWDTQWSQFQTREEFDDPYIYFYLKNKDLQISSETPRLLGPEEGNPDADIRDGSGLIVEGDESQNLGSTTIESNGSDTAASIIGGESASHESRANVNIDDLTIKIAITANYWYFFAFPFDIDYDMIHFNGQFVWRYYDGEYRAEQGSGAWKNHNGTLLAGKGYIFQGSKDGTLELNVGKASIGATDKMLALESYTASNEQNESWNLVGNPFTSYYQLSDMDYSAPITIWNGMTYQALSPLDDDYTLYPYQAFFVQKPKDVEGVKFEAEHRITKNQRDNNEIMSAAKMRRMARAGNEQRSMVNLEISNGNLSDRTRVVFNEAKKSVYEMDCDAAKFISNEAPQIYTLDATNVQYSINERPTDNGMVRVGFIANQNGTFKITATRLDIPVKLKDLKTGKVCDLACESYEFTAETGEDNDRFILINENVDVTGIPDAAEDDSEATYYGINGMKLGNKPVGISVVKKGEKVEKVYNK